MSVIKDEYIGKEITRHDLLPLSFLKKSVYTGSKGRLNYRLEKAEDEEGNAILKCSSWKSPLCFALTPAEDILTAAFPFDDGGIDAAIVHLNALLDPDEGRRQP